MASGKDTPDAAGADEWLSRLAADLGEPPLTSRETGHVLKLAREVAHGVERKLAPLAAYLAGVHVGRRGAQGVSPDEALSEAVRAAAAILPVQPAADTQDPTSPGGE
jgi:uncharacterized protein DUF6457